MSKEATALVVGIACLVLFGGALMIVPMRGEVGLGDLATRITFEDTSFVELRGSGAGHRSGRESEFAVTIRNGRTAQGDPALDNWTDRYCLVLVDSAGQPMQLADQEFDVSAGGTADFTHRAKMPDGLEDGPYRISVVIPGAANVLMTIWFGRMGQEPWDPQPAPPPVCT